MELLAIAVAAYAAIVATGSLIWQIYAWRHRRQSQVTVSTSVAILDMPAGPVEAIGIEVKNKSEHAVRVTGVGFEMQDDTNNQMHLLYPQPGATIPGTVQPHDSGQTWLERTEFEKEGLSPFEPVVAWVRLATGERVRSAAHPVLSR